MSPTSLANSVAALVILTHSFPRMGSGVHMPWDKMNWTMVKGLTAKGQMAAPHPHSATSIIWDLEQITKPLWASASPSIKWE